MRRTDERDRETPAQKLRHVVMYLTEARRLAMDALRELEREEERATMPRRIIEWDGRPFAALVETPDGDYLVPPIVLDEEGRPIEGREVLAAIAESGVAVEHPVVEAAPPGDLAEIDQRMAQLSEELGVPLFGEEADDA